MKPVYNYFKLNQPNYIKFKGSLSKELSRNALEIEDIYSKRKKVLAKRPDHPGIVGNLPYEWIAQIPKDKRADSIKNFYNTLKVITDKLKKKPNSRITRFLASKKTTAYLRKQA